MAINDVSLTSGMRSNLLALQGTVDLLNRTQSRLSTGKKVNTAIDNPVSFFASQALTSRASIIDSLKDSMGQAVQTINAADKGITAINSMIEQAKGIAQAALSAEANSGYDTGAITFSGLVDGDSFQMGNVVFTARNNPVPYPSAGDAEFYIGGSDLMAMYSLADSINNYAINNGGFWPNPTESFRASVVNGAVILAATDETTGLDRNIDAGDLFDFSGKVNMSIVPATNELSNLMAQYNELRTQLTELAADSGYKGKNLLSDDNLVVKFEGTTLTVEGFDASATGLGITQASWTTGVAETKIDADIVLLDAALGKLRQESSKMSGNLSIITVRQEFSTNMINTLTEGSDKLTLADANEEGANMLMLQTRQSLSTTALSMSAQAAQSVLRLFQ